MTYTEVLELIRAGFNKAEIEEMMKAESSTPAKPAPTPPQEEQQVEMDISTDKQEVKEEKPVPSETEKLVAALGMKFDALTQALQTKNVGSIEGSTTQTTTDDIIARIINPHYGEE